ncbi:MAG: single-stranded-DNA-specific exonuclease RecJ [Granulosicoccus sp.]
MSLQLRAAPEALIRQRTVPTLNEPLSENALVHRILAARGVRQRQELSFALADIPRPDTLPSIVEAVQRLLSARDNNERVLIVGDYDCDGATSTVVALQGLAMLGFRDVDYLIPDRFEFGYGLSPAITDVAHQQYQPQLIVTVDNGVASVEGVERAREHGIDVVVTDHHLAPEILPDAVSIVNPNLPGASFPGNNLAGVGVIFYTLLAVRAQLKERGDPYANARLTELLDLVAIGTVADVVPLDAINRTLVEQGLRRIRAGSTRPGILALLKIAGRDSETITTEAIGFGIGPRLNAAGRLDDMRIGVQCLLSETNHTASEFAEQLNSLNSSRQSIESDMRSDAVAQLDNLQLEGRSGVDTFAICLMNESWHQGVIGILAGRVKEATYKPVALFTVDDGEHLKGSVRSIPGVHIRDVLQNIAVQYPQMIAKFGGHAMAAGLTLPIGMFDSFRDAFDAEVRRVMNGELSVREYLTDGQLTESERTLDNARLLARFMPWGQGFEAPLFDDVFRVIRQKAVGRDQSHLKLTLESPESGRSIDAIAFNQEKVNAPEGLVRVVYSLDANLFRGAYTLQLRVQYLEACSLR